MTECFSSELVCAATALFNRPWSGLHAISGLAAGLYVSHLASPAASAVGSVFAHYLLTNWMLDIGRAAGKLASMTSRRKKSWAWA